MTSRQMAHILSCSVPLMLSPMAAEPVEQGQACLTEMVADVDIRATTPIRLDNRQTNKRATAESPRPIIVLPTSGRPLNLKLHR